MESTNTFEQASLWEIVKAAPLAVQLVMGLLVLLSIATWAIIIEKGYRIWQDNRQARNFEVKLEQFKTEEKSKSLVLCLGWFSRNL